MGKYLDYHPFRIFGENPLSYVIYLTDDAIKMLKGMLLAIDKPTVHVLDYHPFAKYDIKVSSPLRYEPEFIDDGTFGGWLPMYSIEVRTRSLDRMMLIVGFTYGEMDFTYVDGLGKYYCSDTMNDELKAFLTQLYLEAKEIHSYLKGN